MLNIVVPMAGRGSRFANAGFTIPKPLIPVGGKPMIQWVIDNVRPKQPHRFTFICLEEHLVTYPEVPATLKQLCPGCNIVTVKQVTEGAACTVLLAKEIINNDDPLMIANADQYVELDINAYLAAMETEKGDGLIMTFWADHPKWSYCRMKADGTVKEVLEKQVVSNEATVGIYNFRHGREFVRAAEQMIAKNLRVNNEFYVAPAYNQLIEEGQKVVIAATGREYDGMYGLGTPEDLNFFTTTSLYVKGAVPDAPAVDASPAALTARRSRIYAQFFDLKNIAGVFAILADDAHLTDPNADIHGRDSIIAYIKQLYAKYPKLIFTVRQVIAEGDSSVIEFELKLSDSEKLHGVDVIAWNEGRIVTLRAYLNPV